MALRETYWHRSRIAGRARHARAGVAAASWTARWEASIAAADAAGAVYKAEQETPHAAKHMLRHSGEVNAKRAFRAALLGLAGTSTRVRSLEPQRLLCRFGLSTRF